MTTAPEDQRQDRGLGLTRRLLRRSFKYRSIIVVGLISMILAAGAQTAPIWLAKIFVEQVLTEPDPARELSELDEAISEKVVEVGRFIGETLGFDTSQVRSAALVVIAAGILLLSLVAASTTFVNEYIAKYLSARVVADLRQSMMAKVLQLPIAYFSRRKIGDLVSRFSTDTQATFYTVNLFYSEMLLQPLILGFALSAVFVLNWRMALVCLVFVPLVVIPMRRVGRRVLKRSRRSLDTLGETLEAVNQVISGQRVVKAFRMEDAESRHFSEVNDKWVKRQASLVRAKSLNRAIMNVLDGFTLTAALSVGGYMVIQEKWDMTAGTLTSFLVAMAYLFRPVKRISVAYNHWQESIAAAGRLFEVLDHPEIPADHADARAIGPIRKGLRFKEVGFAYDNDEGPPTAVLEDLTFSVQAGRTVALVGPSGAGKSTIADLIFRFYEPTRGSILVDDVPLESISRDSLIEQIAVVSQHPFLFNTSVSKNIAYGNRAASQQDIEEAARAACIHDVIVNLPDGYDTLVGERGATLSGGQLQRITIARAILKNASFLLLDEATSSLDVESEKSVQEALGNLMKGRTALVIAHRLSTIVDADSILVIDKGRLVEEGTHEELVARRGDYHRLYQTQLGA